MCGASRGAQEFECAAVAALPGLGRQKHPLLAILHLLHLSDLRTSQRHLQVSAPFARSLAHPFVSSIASLCRVPPFAAPSLPFSGFLTPSLFRLCSYSNFLFSVFQSLELLPAVQDGVCDYRGTTCDRSGSLRTQETKLTFQATTITGRCQCT